MARYEADGPRANHCWYVDEALALDESADITAAVPGEPVRRAIRTPPL